MIRRPPSTTRTATPFPYTTLFRSGLFAAARVSMGALGVIARRDVRLQPAYKLKLTKQPMELDECLARAPDLARSYRHLEFYWVPHTRGTLVKLMEPTQERESNTALTGLLDRKSTRLNSSHSCASRMPSSALQTPQITSYDICLI